jgi:hypothetical protein
MKYDLIFSELCDDIGSLILCYYRRIDIMQELKSVAGLEIPVDLSSDEANEYLSATCVKYGVKCSPPQTTARLLDKVFSDSLFIGLYLPILYTRAF